MEHEGAGILVKVTVPDLKCQTRVVINKLDPIGSTKETVLEKITHDWPLDVCNNYGLFISSSDTGKHGKFLDETRPLSDYALHGISGLELRYKKRDYGSSSISEKSLAKANSKSNQKKLIEHINSGSVKKIVKLLEAGLDPNFIMEDGNTPLGVACGRNGHIQCIMPLISDGGAHVDFKGSNGLTPMHRAAIGGNSQAIKMLLSMGASPNCLDNKGLTPLYHASMIGDDISVCEALLKQKAYVGTLDNIGWSELHQIAKHGYHHLIDIILIYGADINLQNKAGNTPLHVAAQHGQLRAALHLLQRGADRSIVNSSGQPPNQIAILCGQHKVAKEILDFQEGAIDLITETKGPKTTRHVQMASNTLPHPSRSKQESLPKLVKGKNLTSIPAEISPSKQMPSLTYSPPASKNTRISSRKAPPPPPVTAVGSKRGKEKEVEKKSSPSLNDHSPSQKGRRYSTDRKANNSPPLTSPTSTRSPSPSLRERLYPITTVKKYIAVMDIEPQQDEDLRLTKGADVEVLYIGKGGYWEGRANGLHGWFPQNAIKEKTFDDDNDDSSLQDKEEEEEKFPPLDDTPSRSGIKTVAVHRGEKGFGFGMKGIKAVNIAKFKPSPNIPALQYVARVDKNGPAENAGLEKGDFIIDVNGNNTTYRTHEEVVDIIKQAGDTLIIRVITPATKKSKDKSKDSPPKQQPTSLKKKQASKHEEKQEEEEENISTAPNEPVAIKTSPKLHNKLSQESDSEDFPHHKTSVSSLATVTHKMSPVLSMSKKESPSSSPVKTKPPTMRPSDAISHSSPKHTKNIDNVQPIPIQDQKTSRSKQEHIEDDSSKQSQSKFKKIEPAVKYEIASAKTEELLLREQEKYKELMDEEDEEESLSEFAKQLRKASKDHFRRSTSQKQEISQSSNDDDNTYGNYGNNDDDDGWELTEALTSWDDINNHDLATSSPKVQRGMTTSSPKVQQGMTTSSPKAQQGLTTSSPKVQQELTTSSPKVQQGMTTSSPKVQQGLTTSSPKVMTTSSPKVQQGMTTSSPKVQTPSSPKVQDFKISSPKKVPPPTKPKPSSLGSQTTTTANDSKPTTLLTSKVSSEADQSITMATSISPHKSKREFKNLGKKFGSNLEHSGKSTAEKVSPEQIKKFSPEKEKKNSPKQQRPVSEVESPLPVLSLKDKFEKLAKAGAVQSQSPKLKPSLPKNSPIIERKSLQVINKDNKEEAIPPPVFEDFESRRFSIISVDDDLPLPADLLEEINNFNNNEEENTNDSFIPPPVSPPDHSDKEDFDDMIPPPNLQEDFLPPPVFDDSEEEGTCVVEDATKLSLPPLGFGSLDVTTKPSHYHLEEKEKEKDEGEDLLGNIVNNLMKLTNSDDKDNESDEESEGSPPPLPNSPPPGSDEEGDDILPPFANEENENGSWIDVLPNMAPPNSSYSMTNKSHTLDTALPNSNIDNLPPVNDLPPPDIEDLPPIDELPPALLDDLEDDLPPIDELPPAVLDLDDLEDVLPPPAVMQNELQPDIPPAPIADIPPAVLDEVIPVEDIPPAVVDEVLPVEDIPPAIEYLDDLPPPPPIDFSDEEEEEENLELPPAPMDDSYEEDIGSPPLVLPPPVFTEEDTVVESKEEPVKEFKSEEGLPSEPVTDWSVDKVCDWLTEIGLEAYCQTFRDNEIVGEHLVDLSRDDIKDLGINKIGHIKTLLQKLQELQK